MDVWRRIAVSTLVCVPLSFPAGTGAERAANPERGLYSRDAIFVCSLPHSARPIRIPSPDGKKTIVVKPEGNNNPPRSILTVQAFGKEFEAGFTWSPNCEVAWSPDSLAFFVTYTMGGAIGTFVTDVYFMKADGWDIVKPTVETVKEFMSRPHYCYWDEDPNVGAIKWLGDSSRLLVAAEFLPNSNCEEMGSFRAYEISVPKGKIAKTYDQLAAKKLFWLHLGDELRNADDECLKKPKYCRAEAIKMGRTLFTK